MFVFVICVFPVDFSTRGCVVVECRVEVVPSFLIGRGRVIIGGDFLVARDDGVALSCYFFDEGGMVSYFFRNVAGGCRAGSGGFS